MEIDLNPRRYIAVGEKVINDDGDELVWDGKSFHIGDKNANITFLLNGERKFIHFAFDLSDSDEMYGQPFIHTSILKKGGKT
jgi:hypothetical protein